jgi:hypothetical protein
MSAKARRNTLGGRTEVPLKESFDEGDSYRTMFSLSSIGAYSALARGHADARGTRQRTGHCERVDCRPIIARAARRVETRGTVRGGAVTIVGGPNTDSAVTLYLRCAQASPGVEGSC